MLVKALVLCGALVCLLRVSCDFIAWLDTPIMVKSTSTKKCVFWEDKNGRHPCSTLPSDYETVWGE